MLTTRPRPTAPPPTTSAAPTGARRPPTDAWRPPSRRSTRSVRALTGRRTTRVNRGTAVVLATLGLAAVHGQFDQRSATDIAFSVGRVSPPAGAVGRADVTVPGVEMPMAPSAMTATPAAPAKAMPTGKGMWIYEFPRTEGANMEAIVARAKANGITHVYPRMGSHWDGFNARQYMDAFLPVAHAAGLKVFGWDFPRLGDSLASDIERARTMITFTSSSGDRLDGFSADIETVSEGSHVSPEIALVYGRALREIAGPDFTLIATVPRPSPRNRPDYPYGEIVESFDAIAPMVYWLNRQPDTDVIGAMDNLAQFGKPVFPVGQAYDGGAEGGRAGVPPPAELQSFMQSALAKGATGVSFWSWQAADGAAWNTIRDATEFSS